MADKATKTIRIKWIRSGIGFPYTQKVIVRSLGLRKLNQVVERPDTPQIRGVVAKVPHLLAIVEPPVVAAWAAIPEFTVHPPEVAPVEKVEAAAETPHGEGAVGGEGGEAEPVTEEASEESKAKKHAAPAESKKAKSAKTMDKKSKKGAAGKQGKPAKTGKK
ncbi:MAG: 50S ribosomal protein L30 [Acidobacteriia bacterium]|nr:50S ribosomal protein L30 [Terriglobia bacterium]